MVNAFWRRCGSHLSHTRILVVDSLLTHLLTAQFPNFIETTHPPHYVWHPLLASIVEGTLRDCPHKTMWFKDVEKIYCPMSWGDCHWVGLVIDLATWHIYVLDPCVTFTSDQSVRAYMAPVVKMLPHLIMGACDRSDIVHVDATTFSYSRVRGLPQFTSVFDSGPLALKFIEMHCHEFSVAEIGQLEERFVRMYRLRTAIDVYQEFVGKLHL